jgi:sulfonate transport system substrate-binding protein
MTVALLAKGVDAFVAWDPAPVIGMKDVPGAIEVIRGGDVISYLGFNIALRPLGGEERWRRSRNSWRGVSEADQWMRKNPKQAAAHRHALDPGLKLDVAGNCDAVQHRPGGPPHFRAQLSCAVEGAGHASAAGRDQVRVST